MRTATTAAQPTDPSAHATVRMASYSNRSALENRQHSVPASVGAHIYQLEAQHAKEMRNLQAKHHQARQLLQKNAAKLEERKLQKPGKG